MFSNRAASCRVTSGSSRRGRTCCRLRSRRGRPGERGGVGRIFSGEVRRSALPSGTRSRGPARGGASLPGARGGGAAPPAPPRAPGHALAVVLFQAAPEVAHRFPICRRERCDVLFIDPDGLTVRENQEVQAEIGPLHAVVEERSVTGGVEIKTGGGAVGADPGVEVVGAGG